MSNQFQKVFVRKPRKSMFDLSHQKQLTCNAGELIPILCEEVIPGDNWRINTELMVRLQPLVAPAMQNMDVYVHYFYVPNRLLWSNWEKFITTGVSGTDATVAPYIAVNANTPEMARGMLGDYLGVQFSTTNASVNTNINALPFAAYQKIVNDYYIDVNLNGGMNYGPGGSPEKGFVLSDGSNAGQMTGLCSMRTRAWGKDYFTSALPWSQRGGAVEIPITGDAPVLWQKSPTNQPARVRNASTGSLVGLGNISTNAQGDLISDAGGAEFGASLEPNDTLYADLSEVTAATIEELRRATKLQQWLEKSARGGSRFYEQIKMFFGVTVPDSRLQRAEYIGGGRQPILISEVVQTSATVSGQSPQGNMVGHGIGYSTNNKGHVFCPEHGFVIGIMSVLPKATYQGGIRRQFLKMDNFDYAFLDFAQLGEQPIYNAELYAESGTGNKNLASFGYAPRYSEYKFIPSSTHGDFRASGTMKNWNLSRFWTTLPVLNNSFVKYSTDERIFAVTDPNIDKYLINVFHNIKAVRPLPYYNEPSFI